jgi:hypothetical protein
MRFSRAVGLACGGAWLWAALVACGSSGGSGVDAAGGGGSAGNASNASGGGPDLGTLPNQSGGSSSFGDCAGKRIDAKRFPLDMYVMLDVSGSMLQQTEGDASLTKWQAVTSALSAFVSDPASAGISMGLQTFPLRHPDAPKSCRTNAECGPNFGRCFTKTCWTFGGNLGACDSDADCGDTLGDCVEFGSCANDDTFLCRNPGGECGTDRNTGKVLGACVAQPAECTVASDCRAIDYATPAVPIAQLPGAQAALLGAIQMAKPDRNGLTPTGPALAGALSLSSSWAQAHPDHQVVAVLATDGMPTLQSVNQACASIDTQAELDKVPAMAAAAKAGTPSISTFVIGVIGPDDTSATTTLQSIAVSGGSHQAFIVDTRGDVQAQFRQALDQIRGGLSCDLAVPEADLGVMPDYTLVNVDFIDKSGKVEHLPYIETEAGCAANPRAWYYDVSDPKLTKPGRILVCPAVCTDFQSTDVGSVDIRLGCKSIRPPE